MKKYLLLAALLLAVPFIVTAHPGRTASDGCHYCRTNCDRWGEAWNERHCHGGYVAPQPIYTPPPPPPALSNFNPADYYTPPAQIEDETESDFGWGWVWLLLFGAASYYLLRRSKKSDKKTGINTLVSNQETKTRSDESIKNHGLDGLEPLEDADDEVNEIMERHDLEYDDALEVQEIMDDLGVDEDDAVMIKEES